MLKWYVRLSGLLSLFAIFGLILEHPALALSGSPETPSTEGLHILWKVQSSQNLIFLAGSIHVLQKHHYPLDDAFDEAFKQSSRVIFEVDLDELSSPEAQMDMLKKGFLRNEESLLTVLSSENYAETKTKLNELGLEIESFHRMKPWMTATAVMALEFQKLGFESAYGVDRHFFEKAHANGKAIQRLETVEFQLNLFDQLPLETQVQFLLQTLEDLKDLGTQIDEMVKAWEEGNVQELETLLVGMREFPDLYRSLVTNRNNDWLPYLEQALQEKESIFIVVGALHLLGKDGLVSALKEKGYLVEQL